MFATWVPTATGCSTSDRRRLSSADAYCRSSTSAQSEVVPEQGEVVPELRITGMIARGALKVRQRLRVATLDGKSDAEQLAQDGGAGK